MQATDIYLKSLKDVVDRDIVGTGYDGLLNQLINQVDNLSRPKGSLKRKMVKDNKHSKLEFIGFWLTRWLYSQDIPQGYRISSRLVGQPTSVMIAIPIRNALNVVLGIDNNLNEELE